MKKLISILVAFAMMATLAVCMAFAADAQQANNVNLSKTLTKNAGTTTPAGTHFDFNVIERADLGDNHIQDVEDQVFNFPAENDPATQSKDFDALIEEALADQPNGLYVYDVKEDKAASSQTDATAGNTFTYSDNVYRVRVYKSATGYKYTVSLVTNYGETNESENKITPTGTGDESAFDMAFENTYVKTAVVDPDGKPDDPTTPDDKEDDNDAAGLFVQKNVTNDASGLYTDKEFEIAMTVEAPAVNTLKDGKTGYAFKVMKVKATGEEEEVTAKAGTLAPGATGVKVNLKTDERIVFIDLDIGAKVTVKEADYTGDFAPTATLNGTTKDQAAVLSGIEATAAETGAKLYIQNENNNGTTPTGILISNLPYIALALVAIGGLVAYVVVRRRQSDEA